MRVPRDAAGPRSTPDPPAKNQAHPRPPALTLLRRSGVWDDAGRRGRTPLVSTLSTRLTTTTFIWVRAALLIIAGALGLGMLFGTAVHGPLVLGTALQV